MHPWFRGIDWENIHRYPAPYHPELNNPEDTRHFDDDIPAEVRSFLSLISPRQSAPPSSRWPLRMVHRRMQLVTLSYAIKYMARKY